MPSDTRKTINKTLDILKNKNVARIILWIFIYYIRSSTPGNVCIPLLFY